jgi:hypothetical protein
MRSPSATHSHTHIHPLAGTQAVLDATHYPASTQTCGVETAAAGRLLQSPARQPVRPGVTTTPLAALPGVPVLQPHTHTHSSSHRLGVAQVTHTLLCAVHALQLAGRRVTWAGEQLRESRCHLSALSHVSAPTLLSTAAAASPRLLLAGAHLTSSTMEQRTAERLLVWHCWAELRTAVAACHVDLACTAVDVFQVFIPHPLGLLLFLFCHLFVYPPPPPPPVAHCPSGKLVCVAPARTLEALLTWRRRATPTQYTPAQLPAYVEGTPLRTSLSRPSHARFLGQRARCYRVPLAAPAATTSEGEGEAGERALRQCSDDDSDDDSDDEGGGGVYTAARFETLVRRADVGAAAGEQTLRGVRQRCAALLLAVLQAAVDAAQAGEDVSVIPQVNQGQWTEAADEAASLPPLTDTQRVQQGLAAKQRGTALFKDAQWQQAAAEYSAAAMLLQATAAVQSGEHEAVHMQHAEQADGGPEAERAVDLRREVCGGDGVSCARKKTCSLRSKSKTEIVGGGCDFCYRRRRVTAIVRCACTRRGTPGAARRRRRRRSVWTPAIPRRASGGCRHGYLVATLRRRRTTCGRCCKLTRRIVRGAHCWMPSAPHPRTPPGLSPSFST